MDFRISIGGFEPTTHQQLFIVSLVFEILLFPAIYFLRRSADKKGDNAVVRRSTANFWGRIGGTVRQSAADTAGLFRRLIGQSGFYRLLVFFLFIGFLKAIFLQMDYVFPKWGDRELGFHAPVGKLSAINSIVIILLVPVVGALTQRFAAYRIVISIGEAFYSPRVYEYAAAIAPPGQEASYGSLAYLPFLVGKLLVGSGGWLLAAFCPEHGPRHSG